MAAMNALMPPVFRDAAELSLKRRVRIFLHPFQMPTMPVISVDMVEGKTRAQKRKLIEGFTKTACDVIGCEPDRVTVILRDIPKSSWGKNGKPKG